MLREVDKIPRRKAPNSLRQWACEQVEKFAESDMEIARVEGDKRHRPEKMKQRSVYQTFYQVAKRYENVGVHTIHGDIYLRKETKKCRKK